MKRVELQPNFTRYLVLHSPAQPIIITFSIDGWWAPRHFSGCSRISNTHYWIQHGVKRVRQSREAIEAKKLRDQAKIQEYLALTDDVLSRVRIWVAIPASLAYLETRFLQKKNQDWSLDALHLTSRLLQTNPEFYTVWNYRRIILLSGIFPNRCPPTPPGLSLIYISLVAPLKKLTTSSQMISRWRWLHSNHTLKYTGSGITVDGALRTCLVGQDLKERTTIRDGKKETGIKKCMSWRRCLMRIQGTVCEKHIPIIIVIWFLLDSSRLEL